MSVRVQLTGVGDLTQALRELSFELGDKDYKSKVLVPAVRAAMRPVLAAAQSNAPIDTGGLRLTLQVEARRPRSKDRRSKYVSATDTVISMVTTAPSKKLQAMSEGKGLALARKRLTRMAGAEQAGKFAGLSSDARAIAQEFGTKKIPAQPFLRTALEQHAQSTVDRLAAALTKRIEQFRKK